MIIKFDRGDGTFHLFKVINSSVVFTGPNTFLRALSQAETLPEYFDSFIPGNEKMKGVHSENEEGVRVPEKNIIFYNTTDFMPSHINIFMGKRYLDERFCMRRVSFHTNETEYCIYTEYPVYICDENGKTIEKLK
jgi:hypothetical protein